MRTCLLCLSIIFFAASACEEAPRGPASSGEVSVATPTKIAGAKAREIVAAGGALIDVRTQREWDGGHIEGAKLIPVGEFSSRIAEVGTKDQPVVVYCASGMRSARAAKMLAEAGFDEVYDLGSIKAW